MIKKAKTYRRYLLTLLTVILAFNFLDRIALGLVTQDIKLDLHLTDTQLGLIGGIAFAFFYALMGVPIGRWADEGDRVAIISWSTGIWSAAVAICGLATTFMQLVLIRVVVGVGEAGCIPPAHSLIAEFFAREERARAVSTYMQGISLSLIFGYFAAGWLNQIFGWRLMFVFIGLPGIVLALLAKFSLLEPRRSLNRSSTSTSSTAGRTLEVFSTLWSRRSFRHVLYAFSVVSFFTYGTLQWIPVYFVRRFSLGTGDLGTWLAVTYGIGGIIFTYGGGALASRFAANNESLQLRGMAWVTVLSGALMVCVFCPATAPSSHWAFAWLTLTNSVVMINGPLLGILQTIAPEKMRSVAIALVFLCINLVGMGCGPLVVGMLSDLFRPLVGGDSLRWAMLVTCPIAAWSAWHLWRASEFVQGDIEVTLRESKQAELITRDGALPPAATVGPAARRAAER